MIDVVQSVKDGKGLFEWAEISSVHNGHTLHIKVFRDAMKFNGVPAMTWNFKPIAGDDRTFDGVRLPATAYQMQQIADLLNCMLMTPKVIDMIWLQAAIKFNCVTYVNDIVANSHIHDVHLAIEGKFDDDGESLISCVGKYWCLINHLNDTHIPSGQPGYLLYGERNACNYGWFGSNASGACISPGTKCWQRPGYRHDNSHFDPSQTIRLMHRMARLIRPDGTEEEVDLHDIAKDSALAPLMSHEGVLKYLRQKLVTQLDPIVEPEPEPDPIPIEPDPIPEPEPEPEPKPEPEPERKGIIQIVLGLLRRLFKI